MRTLPAFPNPVDDRAARAVATEVFALDLVAFGLQQFWLVPLVAADFVVRAILGPRFSPLARIAQKTLVPRFGPKPRPTPGPPKRFAAAVGAFLMVGASILSRQSRPTVPGWGSNRRVFYAVGALMLLFPALEGFLGICVGCRLFSLLMRAGIIPESVCEECANIELRYRRLADEDKAAGEQ